MRPLPQLIVLQHPQEHREQLSSVPLLAELLPQAQIVAGMSWPNLRSVAGESAQPGRWGVLYLGSGLVAPPGWSRPPSPALVFVDRKGAPLPDQAGLRDQLQGLVLLDGTWSQAKTLWWRNAWLLKLRRSILLPSVVSAYGRLRREPRRECLSTLEATGQALSALGVDPAVELRLREAFAAAVQQVLHRPAAPRAPHSQDRLA